AELNYRQAIEINPQHLGGYINLHRLFDLSGKTNQAIDFAKKISQSYPDELFWGLKQYLVLPILYQNEEEINFYRHRFTEGLKTIINSLNLTTETLRKNALDTIKEHNNFFLAYQGKNDLNLQSQYGDLLERIIKANNWCNLGEIKKKKIQKKKIRVGYISSYLRNHTVGKLYLGWIKNHNRDHFEIYCYHLLGQTPLKDELTVKYQEYSDQFFTIEASDLENECQKIINSDLDILVFLDIGMESAIYPIAASRLAPIQCLTWGHPVTSGIPTIDYFLSSELMEPQNAQEHYREKLIFLPNISICYPQPSLPEQILDRSFFQLKKDSIIYLSCQSLFKYLPQYDYIFPRIAQQIKDAQFLFLSFYDSKGERITDLFKHRLQESFRKFDLNSEEYCLFLPRLNTQQYLSLNLISDVYLDTFSWSGGNTTLEAIACNLPVVTCPGELMRGRHSYGILKMLGVTETIASCEEEYIEIAVRLGSDLSYREEIREKIQANHHRLYDDLECIKALEKFYQDVIKIQNVT
ncbi:MAG: glycosyl transferase family 1, partial [Geminocystis sp. GBBB08]|nr:glycosyl transferase family 1 [Geminocystis sp. GBBB08]